MKIKKEIELPFEEGKTYMTKFQTKERFVLKEISWKTIKDKKTGAKEKKMVMFWGTYESNPHLGICPLSIDRLKPDVEVKYEEVEVCDKCGKPK